jgi:hypothetical protein
VAATKKLVSVCFLATFLQPHENQIDSQRNSPHFCGDDFARHTPWRRRKGVVDYGQQPNKP